MVWTEVTQGAVAVVLFAAAAGVWRGFAGGFCQPADGDGLRAGLRAVCPDRPVNRSAVDAEQRPDPVARAWTTDLDTPNLVRSPGRSTRQRRAPAPGVEQRVQSTGAVLRRHDRCAGAVVGGLGVGSTPSAPSASANNWSTSTPSRTSRNSLSTSTDSISRANWSSSARWKASGSWRLATDRSADPVLSGGCSFVRDGRRRSRALCRSPRLKEPTQRGRGDRRDFLSLEAALLRLETRPKT